MALGAKKVEHAGPKKGRGAYHGRKAVAKQESSKVRRKQAKSSTAAGLSEIDASVAQRSKLT